MGADGGKERDEAEWARKHSAMIHCPYVLRGTRTSKRAWRAIIASCPYASKLDDIRS